MTAEQVIVRRLLKELRKTQKIALGTGIPELVKPHLPSGAEWSAWPTEGTSLKPVDLVVVEASQISQRGDLSLPAGESIPDIPTEEWIVATLHRRDNGEAKIVRDCTLPISRTQCVTTIITEMGVIKVTEVGLVLTEVAPGVATDDVKKNTAASLHVADDIKLMEL
jgi:acyl CoA:acetate/3-ketoacid CoA transferase beta subunit